MTTKTTPKGFPTTKGALNRALRKDIFESMKRLGNCEKHDRYFPNVLDVKHRVLIEAQGPLLTVNEDGEVSSRDLTDWYVDKFCRLNHLKGA
jgi:hypothetical protein